MHPGRVLATNGEPKNRLRANHQPNRQQQKNPTVVAALLCSAPLSLCLLDPREGITGSTRSRFQFTGYITYHGRTGNEMKIRSTIGRRKDKGTRLSIERTTDGRSMTKLGRQQCEATMNYFLERKSINNNQPGRFRLCGRARGIGPLSFPPVVVVTALTTASLRPTMVHRSRFTPRIE